MVVFSFFCNNNISVSCQHFAPAGEPGAKSFCDFSDVFSCSDILNSKWAYLLGVPVALLGLSWNLIVSKLALHLHSLAMQVNDSRTRRRVDAEFQFVSDALFLWLIAGLGFVLYLLGVELYVGKICPLCTVIHVLTITSFVAARGLRSGAASANAPPSSLSWSPLCVATLLRQAVLYEKTALVLVLLGFVLPIGVFNARAAGNASDASGAAPASNAAFVQCLFEHNVRVLATRECRSCGINYRYFGDAAPLAKQRLWLDCDSSDAHRALCAANAVTDKAPLWLRCDDVECTKVLDRRNGLTAIEELRVLSEMKC